MSPAELLLSLRAAGVTLEDRQGKLAYDDSRGALTDDLLSAMKAHKLELLELLRAPVAMPAPRPTVPKALNPSTMTSAPEYPAAWLRVGAWAPRPEEFPWDPQTRTRPGYWTFLLELHNRRLAVVGRVVQRQTYQNKGATAP